MTPNKLVFKTGRAARVGIDYCGIVTSLGKDVERRKVGDIVLGSKYENVALPSHLTVEESQTVLLPSGMTYEDGATLPVVFFTAYNCLINIGKLQAGETILIHTASGGVGLCAIQIAQKFGAKIIATAGSNRKRTYLKQIMGLEHVFSSRDLEYGKETMRITEGKGVDVVLNSLTSKGFKETSMDVLAKNGRFLEMSKINIWSKEEVSALRSDVTYFVEDMGTDLSTRDSLHNKLQEYLDYNLIKPLPYTKFDITDIRSALDYLGSAKHIGKVVCTFPSISEGQIPLFSDRASYLITGGCGGIGFQVAKWMLKKGAKHLVLMGRRPPCKEYLEEIEKFRKTEKASIHIKLGDVSDYKKCKEVISWINGQLPYPLRGIMHSAGNLSDATIPNQTREKYEAALGPKVAGGINLHKITLEKSTPHLEHFVVFSSVVALLGSPGQSNHAGGNTFLDSLVSYRNSIGLVGSSINWGQWGEHGVAAGKHLRAVQPMTTEESLNVIEHLLRTNSNRLVTVEMDWKMYSQLTPWITPYFSSLKDKSVQHNFEKSEKISSAKFYADLEACSKDNEKIISTIENYVERIVKGILKIEDSIQKNQNFQELGLDSLMIIEQKNMLQQILASRVILTPADIADCNSIKLTAEVLFKRLYGKSDDKKIQDRKQLIREDSVLWDTINTKQSLPFTPTQSIKTILFLGSTGNLGPYVLQQLSKYTGINRIVCLLRGSNGFERLESRLKHLSLKDETEMRKISTIKGDVTVDKLGIEQPIYESLSVEIDAIINCSVENSHLEMYGKGLSTKVGIKAVNILGTQRILEFASRGKVKHVFQASTLFTIVDSEIWCGMKPIPDQWPEENDCDVGQNFGYGITKFISDRLICQAVGKGIPAKVFRFPNICGDKSTGQHDVENNHFMTRYIHYISRGEMPNTPIVLQGVPVDACAEIMLRICFHPEAPSDVYNIINPYLQFEFDLGQLTAEYGPLLQIVENVCTISEELKNNARLGLSKSKLSDLKKKYALKNGNYENFRTIFEILNKFYGDLNPSEIENIEILLMNPRVRNHLQQNHGYKMKEIAFSDFLSKLQNEGQKTRLYKWIDYYARDDSYYRGEFDKVDVSLMSKKWGQNFVKVTKYVNNLKEIMPDNLSCIKNDLDFMIRNAGKVFKNDSLKQF